MLLLYYAFDHFSCDIFADVTIFLMILGEIHHVASFKPIPTRSHVFGIYTGHHWVIRM